MSREEITDNLAELLEVVPPRVREAVEAQDDYADLIEIILDLGRLPEARFPGRFVYLDGSPVTREDIAYLIKRVGRFGRDNRAGIERTLHRISAIRNRAGEIIGVTCRVGRAVFGTIDIVRDVVETGQNILLLGRPGVGKTTLLREVARVLADDLKKRVVIVDTSNEIAGDGDIPHPAIGHARRMQVPLDTTQADVMIEAVENHMPEVIVIDEIGTEEEAHAARTIAERGVQLIGTAHGNTLENLMLNPTLSDLVGGIQVVTLGDELARKRGTQKTVLERKAPPTFDVVVEIRDRDCFAIHHNVAETVDSILRGAEAMPEVRVRRERGQIEVIQQAHVKEPEAEPAGEGEDQGYGAPGPLRIYPYGVSRNRLAEAILEVGAENVYIVRDVHQADVILTSKGQYRRMPKKLREAEMQGISVYTIKSNTTTQMVNLLRSIVPLASEDIRGAIEEARRAADKVLSGSEPVKLSPQRAAVRRLQHELAARYNLKSRSVGVEPHRGVVIYLDTSPPEGGSG